MQTAGFLIKRLIQSEKVQIWHLYLKRLSGSFGTVFMSILFSINNICRYFNAKVTLIQTEIKRQFTKTHKALKLRDVRNIVFKRTIKLLNLSKRLLILLLFKVTLPRLVDGCSNTAIVKYTAKMLHEIIVRRRSFLYN